MKCALVDSQRLDGARLFPFAMTRRLTPDGGVRPFESASVVLDEWLRSVEEPEKQF